MKIITERVSTFIFMFICIFYLKPLNLSADLELIKTKFKEGDIIFQVSNSDQSKAIQIATDSVFSHVGIIFKNENTWDVLEAVQPVKFTPIKEWIERGKNSHYVLKRLKQSEDILTKHVIEEMKRIGKEYVGKDYDSYFEWNDKRFYCSELVWKIYKRVIGIEIGKLNKLKNFNITHPIVKTKLKERFGRNIPLDEKVISPGGMFNSKELKEIED